jgi:hypothetical protein
MAERDEDPSPPFRIAYRPCGAKPVVDVGDGCMCREHALEAEHEGASVDWSDS